MSEDEEFGYNPPLPPTYLSEQVQNLISEHLPRIDPTTTTQGTSYQMSCACGWSAPYSETSASKAGREYDQHLSELLGA